MKYRTIVADPPWPTTAGPSHFQARKLTRANQSIHDPRYTSKTRDLGYSVMSLAEIQSLPVADLAERNAHLYLWTINRYIDAAYIVARAWGFVPSTLLTWCKQPRGVGLGGAFTLANEHVLFCRRGSLPAKQRVDRNWWLWRRTDALGHSGKPDAFIDLVEQVSPGPYVELFARRHRLGWDVWGNESANTVQLGHPALTASSS